MNTQAYHQVSNDDWVMIRRKWKDFLRKFYEFFDPNFGVIT